MFDCHRHDPDEEEDQHDPYYETVSDRLILLQWWLQSLIQQLRALDSKEGSTDQVQDWVEKVVMVVFHHGVFISSDDGSRHRDAHLPTLTARYHFAEGHRDFPGQYSTMAMPRVLNT